ncbi:MAG: hypothetical protein KIT80_23130 [Chitinophagaceae bacterium]|nr:hypothetical protein [Chitinophagaceae bacterium]MCW5929833.1 hypothetical protein [Chitinophagaceae bacterium]
MKRCKYLLLLGILYLISCKNEGPPPTQTSGYKPVYAPKIPDSEITFSSGKIKGEPGKAVTGGNRLFQLEPNKGIHVIDLSNPGSLRTLGFINIPGAHDLEIRDHQLITNAYNDLLVLDVTNLQQLKLIVRVDNAIRLPSLSIPPHSGYFECVDKTKGTVIGWTKTTIYSPKCKY